ncbi:MAG: PQQ-binding-like beta-propeller repeat protein, partial [bacterium]
MNFRIAKHIQRHIRLFILFVLLAKQGEGKMPVFSLLPSTLTSHQLQVGTKGVNSLPGVAIYDLNNDARKDLLIGDKNGNIRFYPNTPPLPPLACPDYFSTYTLLTYGSGAQTIVVDVVEEAKPHITDWNRDGISDLLVGCADGSLFLLIGTTTYIGSDTYFLSPKELEIGTIGGNSTPIFSDFDEDGARDLIIGDGLGRVWWFKNSGSDDAPCFGTVGEQVLVGSLSLDVGENAVPFFIDWDGDGIKDFIVGDNLGYIWFFKGNPATGPTRDFQAGKKISASCGEIDLGFRATPFVYDFDGNGGYDLIAGEAGGTIYTFLNTKKTFAEPPNFNLPYKMPGPSVEINEGIDPSIFVCDYDGDKKDDLIIGTNKGEVYLYKNIGEGTLMLNGGFPLYMTSGTTTIPLDVGYNATPFIYDLDGDAKKDLICGNREGYVLFFKNIGSDDPPLFGSSIYLTAQGASIDVGLNSSPFLADVDRDEKIDLLVGNSLGDVWFFAGSTTTSFKSGVRLSVPSGNINVGGLSKPFVVDWNQDGFLDLLVGSKDLGAFLFLNKGTPSFIEGRQILNGEGLSLSYADFAEDTRKDLIVAFSSGYIRVFPSTGEVSLRLNLTADKNELKILEEATYTLTLSNEGNTTTTNLVVKASLPEKTTWVSGGSYDALKREVSFALPELAGGSIATFTFTLKIDYDYPSNTFTIIGYAESDEEIVPLFSNPFSSEVFLQPLFSLNKEVDPYAASGSTITYTINYSNTRKDASGVVIIDRLPASSTYQSGSAEGNCEYSISGINWEAFETNPVNYIRWNIGSLKKDQAGSVSFRVKVEQGLDEGEIIENVATITDQTNIATSTARTIISSKPVFTITKQASMQTISFGATLTYTINYKLLCNDAMDITLIDKIPSSLTIEDVPQGIGSITYSHDNGITYNSSYYLPITHIKVYRQFLAKEGVGSLTFIVKCSSDLADKTIITNIATITARDAETKTASIDVSVSNIPSLIGTISVSPSGAIAPLWLLTYTIYYQNIGSTSARNVMIKCDADKNPYLANIKPLQGGTIEPNTIVWNVGTVPAGAMGSVSFTAYVGSNVSAGVEINVLGWIVASGSVSLALNPVSSSVFESFDSFCNAWHMFGRDPLHLHYAEDEAVIPPLRVERGYDTSGGIVSSPAITEDGFIYLASDSGEIRAMDMSGATIWATQTSFSFYSSPAIAGTNTFLFIGERNLPGYFYAFDAKTGTLSWKYKTGSHIYSSPVVKYGIVYFGDDGGRVYGLRATDGVPIWVYNAGHQEMFQFSSPVVSDGVLYIGSKDKSLYALDAFSGSPIWIYKTEGAIISSPAIADNIVYVGSDDGYFYALKTGTQTSLVWRYNAGSPIQSSPGVAYGKVYFGANNGRIYALNQGTGSFAWSYQAEGRIFSSPAIASNVVYVASEDGYLYCLDAENGRLLAKYYIGGGIASSPAIERGRLFIASRYSTLYSFIPAPDFVATKTSSIKEVKPGGTITYTISYKNNAFTRATGVLLVDSLDANLGTPTLRGTGTYYSGSHTIVWDLGTISGKEEGFVEFDAPVNASVNAGTITNRAIIKCNEVSDRETNRVDVKVLIPLLMFNKSADQAIASPGSTITYTLSYGNIGNLDATNIVIEDLLPSTLSVTYIQESGVGDNIEYCHSGIWNKLDYPPVTAIRGSISTLAKGTFGTISFKVLVERGVSNGTIIENIGTLSSSECGTITSLAQTYVKLKPQLVIQKQGQKTVNPGQTLTYNISYQSLYVESNNITIIDTIPTNTTSYVSGSMVSPGSVSFSHDNGLTYNDNDAYLVTHIKIQIPYLSANQTGTLSFNLLANDIADQSLIENRISITGIEAESGSASYTTIVLRQPLLSLKKEASPSHTTPAQTLSYKLTYSSQYKDATDVLIEDSLPSSATYIIGSAKASEYNHITYWDTLDYLPVIGIRWKIETLAKDTSGSLTYQLKLLDNIPDNTRIINQATITAKDAQTITTTGIVNVRTKPQLVIQKQGQKTVNPGQTLTYNISYQSLYVESNNITIIDTI